MKANSTQRWLPVLTATALLALGQSGLFAQAADAAAAAPEVSLWDKFLIGGLFMWPILALNITLVGLAVFNGIALSKKRWAPEELKNALVEQMAQCKVRSAIEVASASPSFLGRMSAAALPKFDATNAADMGRIEIEDTMAEFVASETRAPVMYINFFTTIMQAAPMLGLLGTVSGMVSAFAMLAQSKGADPGSLANSISEALYTTYFGLVVAIPSLICYAIYKNVFNSRVAAVMDSAKLMLDSSIAAVQGNQAFAKVPEGLHAE